MATYGTVLRHSAAAAVERARAHARSARRAIARPQSFAPPADAEAAAVRAVNNDASFRIHYAALLWVLLLASLFPRHRATMLFLMAFIKIALGYGALLRIFPLLRRVIDGRLVAAIALIVIIVELVTTGAVPQLLLTLGVGLPIVLLHAVFRARDEVAENGDGKGTAEEAGGGGGGGVLNPTLEKEDIEMGPQKSAD